MNIIEEKLRHWIISSDLITMAPLRIYAIAIDLRWETVAIEAARKTLKTPLEKLGYANELRSIPASGYYRFLEYRLRCSTSSSPQTETLKTLHKRDTGGTTKPLAQVTLLQYDANPGASTDAPEPFDSSKEADLILRSSDSVDFFVFKRLVHLASPKFFDSIFPSHRKTDDGKFFIHVPQNSKVLYQLLSMIYHYVDETDICDFQLYMAIAEAARDWQVATIEKRLRRLALNSPLCRKEPLKLYVLAIVLRWEDITKFAALDILSQPLQEMTYIDEFDRITGEDLYRLVNFRFRCGEAACKSLEAHAAFMQHGPSNWRNFWPYLRIDELPTMENLKAKIKACPRGSTMDSIYVSAISELENCSPQSYNSGSSSNVSSAQVVNIMECYIRIGDIIEETVSKVPVEITEVQVSKGPKKGSKKRKSRR